jgi:hypothetical protein
LSDSALVSTGILFLLMGVVMVVGLRLAPEKPGRRGRQLSEALERPLRRMHLLASESYYRRLSKAMAVPFCLFFILGGVVMIAIGLLR